MKRTDAEFRVAGVTCAAWWYMPDGAGPHPVVVLAHGFTGTRDIRLDAYAQRFCAAGLAALVFDYRHFGDSGGEPRQLLDIGRQLEDWRAAIALARRTPGIDGARVALWGSSFSGGHVVTLAAEDRRVAACVAQVPFMDGLVSVRVAGLGLGTWLAGAALRDQWRAWTGGEPFLVPAVASPGEKAAITAPNAEAGFLALIPEGSRWRNEVAARVFLRLIAYRPVTKAARVTCPLVVCVAREDAITPPEPARRAAQAAPRGELREYPGGHFDVYLGEVFERVVADQTAFLRRVLLTGA